MKRSRETSEAAHDGQAVSSELREEVTAQLLATVREALARHQHLHVRRVVDGVLRCTGASDERIAPSSSEEWQPIESLSRLRSQVGGRFQQLKQRWVAAGFPLKEHRGDKTSEVRLDERAWLELSAWMLKQGYEARLTPERSDVLFEIRAVPRG